MTRKHPNAKASSFDQRFSEAAKIYAFKRNRPNEDSLRESSWFVLKEWVAEMHMVNQAARPMSGDQLRAALFNSKPSHFRHLKEIIDRKNWPKILTELSHWCESNRNLLN
jgi:hypothetical protein